MSKAEKADDSSYISIFNERIKSSCLDIWENHRKAILVIGTISVILAGAAVAASTMGVGGVIIAALALAAKGIEGSIVTGIVTFTTSALIQIAACAFFKKIISPKLNPALSTHESNAEPEKNTRAKTNLSFQEKKDGDKDVVEFTEGEGGKDDTFSFYLNGSPKNST